MCLLNISGPTSPPIGVKVDSSGQNAGELLLKWQVNCDFNPINRIYVVLMYDTGRHCYTYRSLYYNAI